MTEKEEREKELDDALLDILNKGLIQVSENEDGSKGNFDCRKGYVPKLAGKAFDRMFQLMG